MNRADWMRAGAQQIEEMDATAQPETPPPRLLDREQVAATLGVHRRQVGRLTREPGFPAPVGYFRGRMLWDARAVTDRANGVSSDKRLARIGP
jgi:hypothetical protein